MSNLKQKLESIFASMEDYDIHGSIVCKMAVEDMVDFSEEVLYRVFGNTVAPNVCIANALEVKQRYAL